MVKTKDQMSQGQATSQWINNGPQFYHYIYTCNTNIPKQSLFNKVITRQEPMLLSTQRKQHSLEPLCTMYSSRAIVQDILFQGNLLLDPLRDL